MSDKEIDILRADRISKLCNESLPMPEVYGTVSSTNDIAKERARKGAPQLLCIAADSQSAGRGRNGHSFHSPAGTGLYMSIILCPDADPSLFPFITPAAAVFLCDACRELFSVSPKIKWVNDLYLGSKKICGILTESSLGANDRRFAVIGAGINMYRPAGGFPPDIADKAGSLLDALQKDAKNMLCAAFLRRLSELPRNLSNPAWREDIAARYRSLCFVIGKRVTVVSENRAEKATVLDTDNECRLSVRFDNGEVKTLLAGEISILPENFGSV